MINLIEKENREMNVCIYRIVEIIFYLNMWFYRVGARMSFPKMSIPKLSFPKMSNPIMSTVPKCLFPLCLLCQNVYSHYVYCAKMSIPKMFHSPI